MSSRFLDIFGLEHYHQLIKPEEVEATMTSTEHQYASTEWTGEINATGLAIGKMIIFNIPDSITLRGGTITLNLTLSNGETTGPIPVYDMDGLEYKIKSQINTYGYTDKYLMLYNGQSWIMLYASKLRGFGKTVTVASGDTLYETDFDPNEYIPHPNDFNRMKVNVDGLLLTPADYYTRIEGNPAKMTVHFVHGVTGSAKIFMYLQK